ncbi:MAG: hypothetical protein HRT64_10430 [Erythrobacter sp.]|nr:hypothetical protein [Erythrobacter sp.]
MKKADLPQPIAIKTAPHAKVKNAIERLQPKRADGVRVPETAPDGWVHLLVAAAELLNAMLPGEEQTWEQALIALEKTAWSFDEPKSSSDTSVKVWDFFSRNLDWACRTETLVTGWREIGGGGDPFPMAAELWETEVQGLRLKTWSIDPNDPFSDRVDLPCWIWVTRASLERQLERVRRYQAKKAITGVYEGEWLDTLSSLALVEQCKSGSQNNLGYLSELCALGVCQAVADEMTRLHRGEPVERDLHWSVEPQLWASLDPSDLRHSLGQSEIVIERGDNIWQLSGVNFDGVMLRRHLASLSATEMETGKKTPESLATVSPSNQPKWQSQRPSPDVAALFEFLAKAKPHLPGGSREMNAKQLHARYREWHSEERLAGDPLRRTSFEKWRTRYISGARIERGRIIMSH